MSELTVKATLLVGATGSGKSCLGNQLAGKTVFRESNGMLSETQQCNKVIVPDKELGVEHHIIDTGGLFDSHKGPKEVRDSLAAFAELAPNGINAITLVLQGRLNQFVEIVLAAIESFFGAAVWEYCIVVFNQCEWPPEQIWAAVADWKPALERQWRESGTVIRTVPPGQTDGGHLVPESIAPHHIRSVRQAIADTSKVYAPDEFRQVRAKLVRKAAQAKQSCKIDSWGWEMEKANVLLLRGQLSSEEWEKKKNELLKYDAEAESERRRAQELARRLERERDEANLRAAEERRQKMAMGALCVVGGFVAGGRGLKARGR